MNQEETRVHIRNTLINVQNWSKTSFFKIEGVSLHQIEFIFMNFVFLSVIYKLQNFCLFEEGFYLAEQHGVQDLSSPAKDQASSLAEESSSLNHWTTKELPQSSKTATIKSKSDNPEKMLQKMQFSLKHKIFPTRSYQIEVNLPLVY